MLQQEARYSRSMSLLEDPSAKHFPGWLQGLWTAQESEDFVLLQSTRKRSDTVSR